MAKKIPSHAWVFLQALFEAIVAAFKSAKQEKQPSDTSARYYYTIARKNVSNVQNQPLSRRTWVAGFSLFFAHRLEFVFHL